MTQKFSLKVAMALVRMGNDHVSGKDEAADVAKLLAAIEVAERICNGDTVDALVSAAEVILAEDHAINYIEPDWREHCLVASQLI